MAKKKENNKVKEKTNNSFKKKMLLFGIFTVIIITLVIVSCVVVNSIQTDDSYKIAKKLAKVVKKEYSYVKVEEGKRDKDFDYSYEKIAYIYTTKEHTTDDYMVSVAKYNSNYEAQKKADFFKKYDEYAHKKLDGTIIEAFPDSYNSFFSYNWIIVEGNYLISIDKSILKEKNVIKQIKPIIKKYEGDIKKPNKKKIDGYWDRQLEKYSKNLDEQYSKLIDEVKKVIIETGDSLESCTGSECEDILNDALSYEQYEEIYNEIQYVRGKYNEVMVKKQETVNSINNQINEVKRTLNQDQYKEVKNKIYELKDSYYDIYKTDWNNQLSQIEVDVYKKSCGIYGYKDILRNPEDYKGKQAYFFGQIVQKVDSTQYRVGIDCHKYYTMDDYYCDNTIYVTYSGDTNLIEDDMVEMWGTLDGIYTYTTVLGSSLTIPKFDAKYILLK